MKELLNYDGLISKEQDALDLIGKTYGKSKKVLIKQENLAAEFFNLSSGLAGSVLQKFVQYQVQVAFVVDLKTIKSERFKELINETLLSDEYRFFESYKEAADWLAKE